MNYNSGSQVEVVTSPEEVGQLSARGWMLQTTIFEEEIVVLHSVEETQDGNSSGYRYHHEQGAIDVPNGYQKIPQQVLRRVARYIMVRSPDEAVREISDELKSTKDQLNHQSSVANAVAYELNNLKKEHEASEEQNKRLEEKLKFNAARYDNDLKQMRKYEEDLDVIRKAIGTKQFAAILADEAKKYDDDD